VLCCWIGGNKMDGSSNINHLFYAVVSGGGGV
jgi:hypothetical protein